MQCCVPSRYRCWPASCFVNAESPPRLPCTKAPINHAMQVPTRLRTGGAAPGSCCASCGPGSCSCCACARARGFCCACGAPPCPSHGCSATVKKRAERAASQVSGSSGGRGAAAVGRGTASQPPMPPLQRLHRCLSTSAAPGGSLSLLARPARRWAHLGLSCSSAPARSSVGLSSGRSESAMAPLQQQVPCRRSLLAPPEVKACSKLTRKLWIARRTRRL